VPNDHYENVYAITDTALLAVYRTAQLFAAPIRSTYDCGGTSMRHTTSPAAARTYRTFTSTVPPAGWRPPLRPIQHLQLASLCFVAT